MGYLETLLRGPTSEQVGVAASHAVAEAAMRSAGDVAAAGPGIQVDLASTGLRKAAFSRFLVLYMHLFGRLAGQKLPSRIYEEVMGFLIASVGLDLARRFGQPDATDLLRWVVSAREQFESNFARYPLAPGRDGDASATVYYQFASDLSSELGHPNQAFVIASIVDISLSRYRALPFDALLRRVRPSP